ncbi:MAG TPA: hypothetical protein VGD81_01360 [Opitutaceae bacterium]
MLQHHDVRALRQSAWSGVKSIARLYAPAPPTELPGLAGLVGDIRAAQQRIERGERPALDQLNADQLVWRNPHFWRASLELAPVDPTFPLLQALLLASAGDLWQGFEIIQATLQAMPLHPDARRVYLTYSEQFQYAFAASLPRAYWSAHDEPVAKRIAVYTRALEATPDHAELLVDALETGRADDSAPGALVARDRYAGVLARVDPLRASRWHGTLEQRQAGETLLGAWKTFTESYHTPDDREITKLLGHLEAASLGRLALSLARLAPAARGFPSPGDTAVWQRQLPSLLGPAATPLLDAWQAGAVRSVAIGRLPEAGDTAGPVLPPVFAHWLERELASTTFVIQAGLDDAQRQAAAYLERGVLHLYVGDYAAAESDLNRAALLRNPSDAAVMQLARLRRVQRRFAESASLIADAEQRQAPPASVAHNTAMLRFMEGKWDASAAAFERAQELAPDETYFLIHGTVARLRAGKPADPERLRAALAKEPPGAWPGKLLAHLAGNLSEAELMDAARSGNEQQVLEQACEAYFVLAEERLAAGDETRGVQLLRDCLDTGAVHFFEYELARAELQRLRPNEPTPARRPPAPPERPRKPGERPTPSNDPIDALVPA